MMATPEFSRLIDVERLVDGESDISLEATVDEMARLAKRFDLVEISRLEAQLHIDYDKSKGQVEISGFVEADIVQTCVVTLEPIPAKIKAPIGRNYRNAAKHPDTPKEIDISGDVEDPPEPIAEGSIDVGEAVSEQLALEMDPFPRSPGIEFQGFSSDSAKSSDSELDSDKPANPFAVLAQLKRASEN